MKPTEATSRWTAGVVAGGLAVACLGTTYAATRSPLAAAPAFVLGAASLGVAGMRWDVFYALGAVLLGVGFVSALVGLDRLADNATFGCVVSFGLAVTILPVARFAARIGLLTQQ